MSDLFYGIGFNSKRKHRAKVNNKHTPAYRTWRSMFQRCYCYKYHKSKPSYIGCTVDDSFHDFQDFADWFYNHPYSGAGYQLDKDLLVPNNKIYSPTTCSFVPMELNVILTDHAAARGRCSQGVSFNKRTSKYVASISIDGKPNSLGYFHTEDEAYQAYKTAKEAYVKQKALEWQDRIAPNVFNQIMNWTLSG